MNIIYVEHARPDSLLEREVGVNNTIDFQRMAWMCGGEQYKPPRVGQLVGTQSSL